MEPVEDHLFSNGLYLANLAVSSNILVRSWKALSEYQGDDPVNIIEAKHPPDYNIIAFVRSSSVTTSNHQEKIGLDLEISGFQFLLSETLKSSSINANAFSQFNSLRNELPQLLDKLDSSLKDAATEVKTFSKAEASEAESNEKKEPIPCIITGQSLNGSIASLFTLSLLNTLDPTKDKLPLCITFGSPLLGDTAFQQAISRHPIWNSCFLHVVHKEDHLPRLPIGLPTSGQSSYMPFGTYLLCSESGWACFQNPYSVIELLTYNYKGLGIISEDLESCTFNYEKVINCLERMPFPSKGSSFLGHEADSYKAGITAQVAAVGLWQSQQQDEGTSTLIEKVVKYEKSFKEQQSEELDRGELEEMKVYLTFLEWYINKCRGDNGQRPGYYDSFKNAQERHDNGVDKYKTYLTVYWEKVVEYAERKPQLPNAPLRDRWLFGGLNYRRMVEPLDIAEYYRRGRKDYMTRGRSKHYKRLENWLEDYQQKKREKSNRAGKQGKETQDGPSKSKVVNVTEDSCFWAHVEDEIRSCRLLDRARVGSSVDSERKKPFDFEEYVMDLIRRKKVSSDIFLEKSSYMQWWREYHEILKKEVEAGSHFRCSELVNYMMEGSYKKYGEVLDQSNC